MQIALRPIAIRTLLLVAGVVLGVVTVLTAFAAFTSGHADSGIGSSGTTVTARGVTWN